MSNGVRVELDNKERELKFTFGAMAAFEKQMEQTWKQAVSNFSDTAMLNFYWAGLSHKDKGLTLQRTASILDKAYENGHTEESLYEHILEALVQSGRAKQEMLDAFRDALNNPEDVQDYEDTFEDDEDDLKND